MCGILPVTPSAAFSFQHLCEFPGILTVSGMRSPFIDSAEQQHEAVHVEHRTAEVAGNA
jgi:hypothetical protein